MLEPSFNVSLVLFSLRDQKVKCWPLSARAKKKSLLRYTKIHASCNFELLISLRVCFVPYIAVYFQFLHVKKQPELKIFSSFLRDTITTWKHYWLFCRSNLSLLGSSFEKYSSPVWLPLDCSKRLPLDCPKRLSLLDGRIKLSLTYYRKSSKQKQHYGWTCLGNLHLINKGIQFNK